MSNLAEEMKANALEAQRFSRKHLVLELDYSESSIDELESEVDMVEFAIPGGKSAENIELLTRIWGAYLGETLRRLCDAQWVEDGGQPAVRTDNGLAHPHEHVRRRLLQGEQHNLLDYFNKTKEQLLP